MGNEFSFLKTSYKEYNSAEEARKHVKHACSDAGVRDTIRSVSLRSSPLPRRVVQSECESQTQDLRALRDGVLVYIPCCDTMEQGEITEKQEALKSSDHKLTFAKFTL
jgi:hypothetical protein